MTVTAPERSPGFVTLYPARGGRWCLCSTRFSPTACRHLAIINGGERHDRLYENVPYDLVVDLTGAFARQLRRGFVPVATRRLATHAPGPSPARTERRELKVPWTAACPPMPRHSPSSHSAADDARLCQRARRHTVAADVVSQHERLGPGRSRRRPSHPFAIPASRHHTVVGTSRSTWLAPRAERTTRVQWLLVPPAAALVDTRDTHPRAWLGGTVELPARPGAAVGDQRDATQLTKPIPHRLPAARTARHNDAQPAMFGTRSPTWRSPPSDRGLALLKAGATRVDVTECSPGSGRGNTAGATEHARRSMCAALRRITQARASRSTPGSGCAFIGRGDRRRRPRWRPLRARARAPPNLHLTTAQQASSDVWPDRRAGRKTGYNDRIRISRRVRRSR